MIKIKVEGNEKLTDRERAIIDVANDFIDSFEGGSKPSKFIYTKSSVNDAKKFVQDMCDDFDEDMEKLINDAEQDNRNSHAYEGVIPTKESMDGKNVQTIIEYVRDALDEVENYINKNGSVPEDIAEKLNNLNKMADSIYEQITIYKNEATSGIGAGSYTTKAIDLMKENDSYESVFDYIGMGPDKQEYEKDFPPEKIKDMIEFTNQEGPHAFYINPDKYLWSCEYGGQTYYAVDVWIRGLTKYVGKPQEVEDDDMIPIGPQIETAHILHPVYDENGKQHEAIIEATIDEGGPESGPEPPDITFIGIVKINN